MPLVDFCFSHLGTTIRTDSCSGDQYPISNLTSSSLEAKKKGFMVDYFVRPPVCIMLTFAYPIRLSRVHWDLKVGRHKCKLFEVWAAPGEEGSGPLVRVGRAHIQHQTQDSCCFQNFAFPGNQYQGHSDRDKFRLASPAPHGNLLDRVKMLHIKILCAFESGIPCLSNLSVWGCLSRGAPAFLRQHILPQQAVSESGPDIQPESVPHVASSSEAPGVPEEADTRHECSTPEEFLDALTYRRMEVPMVLPCGQVVDRSTLDAYSQQEAKWGRAANDPFTAKLFSSQCHPVFDHLLKSRIDAFVLQRNDLSVTQAKHDRPVELSHPPPAVEATEGGAAATIQWPSSSSSSTPSQDALSEAVCRTLAARRRIIMKPTARSSSECVRCGVINSHRYRLPCGHLMCRSCLSGDNPRTCNHCDRQFAARDVRRFHCLGVDH